MTTFNTQFSINIITNTGVNITLATQKLTSVLKHNQLQTLPNIINDILLRESFLEIKTVNLGDHICCTVMCTSIKPGRYFLHI